MIRACVGGGGWRWGLRWDLVTWEFRSCCRDDFNDGGGFDFVKYSAGLFTDELGYFIRSGDIEVGS